VLEDAPKAVEIRHSDARDLREVVERLGAWVVSLCEGEEPPNQLVAGPRVAAA
jgi:hypothetical protein